MDCSINSVDILPATSSLYNSKSYVNF